MTIDLRALKHKHGQNDLLVQGELKSRLREAGIPVVGVLGVETVERGRLTLSFDDLFGEAIYEWTDER